MQTERRKMPYIKQNIRRELDSSIDNIVKSIRSYADIDGIVNYIVTRIVVETFLPLNYKSCSNMIKTLECSKLEIYRRLIAPYECLKDDENGDLDCFKGN
jgi:hypothetical protein